MADHQVDLLVIGAGASGASVAYEATRRGLSVALLEAGDIGGGTSCRSTKLLHGGVRYLELAFKTLDLAQLRLVREALLERSHWLTQAPFLAQRLELALPTQQLWGQAYYRLGLGMYDALAGQRSIGHSRLLSQQQMRQALPLLKPCQGGVAYSDGQFDDARLNLLLALTAEQRGATLRTRCRVVELETDGTGQLKAAISESATGQRERWCASAFVNATGIRADEIRQMAEADAPPRLLTSRGAHIVLEQNLCPEGLGLLVPSTADGRVLFMLPFHGRTLVGTTDEACTKENATSPSACTAPQLEHDPATSTSTFDATPERNLRAHWCRQKHQGDRAHFEQRHINDHAPQSHCPETQAQRCHPWINPRPLCKAGPRRPTCSTTCVIGFPSSSIRR